jgi:hypothetical protein
MRALRLLRKVLSASRDVHFVFGRASSKQGEKDVKLKDPGIVAELEDIECCNVLTDLFLHIGIVNEVVGCGCYRLLTNCQAVHPQITQFVEQLVVETLDISFLDLVQVSCTIEYGELQRYSVCRFFT